MSKLIKILIIIFTTLLILNTFIWFIAQGSGHNIPFKTNLKFGIASVVLVLLVLITYANRNFKKNKKA